MQNKYNKKISEIVLGDYRTADVFRKHGINYCCSGSATLKLACETGRIDPARVINDLDRATINFSVSANLPFEDWKPSFLVDYIIHVHHDYIRIGLPVILDQFTTFAWAHSHKMPWLQEMLDLFVQLSKLLEIHCRQQEDVIFPYIRHLEATQGGRETYGPLFVRMLRKPLEAPSENDAAIALLFTALRQISKEYSFAANACATHRVVFLKLKELDDNWHAHAFLEQEYLFPGATNMEELLLQA